MVGLSRSALWRTSSVNVTGEILPRMISGASVLIVLFIAECSPFTLITTLARLFFRVRKNLTTKGPTCESLVLEPEKYATVADAFKKLVSLTKVVPRVERIATPESYGRVLAESIVPRVDLPSRPVSHMDGYAVNALSLAEASEEKPVRLQFRGEVRLGEIQKRRLGRGEAIRVPTGGYLPSGADAVVPVERATARGKFVFVAKYHSAGSFVYPKGADVARGVRVLDRGRQLRPQDVGLLLSLGIDKVAVYRRPRVAIIATGNELTDSLTGLHHGRVRNSHGFVFSKLVEEMGGVAVDLGVVKDDVKKIARMVKQALGKAEMVVTIGGTSLGGLDLVGDTLRKFVKPSQIVHGIRMDRGRVAGVTAIQGKPVVMLPGPIQGAMSAFVLFVAPMIGAIGGHDATMNRPMKAKLTEAWEARKRVPNFTKVVYVRLSQAETGLEATPMVGETESMTILTSANGYVIVPEERTEIPRRGTVEVHLLPGFSYLADRLFD